MHACEKSLPLADLQFAQFLMEATTYDDGSGFTLGPDPLFGLYTSWCHVTGTVPHAEETFWEGMQGRINPEPNGLRMKGPAAADYILASYPASV
jgi:hypothetical protein